ncbi:hypothetical protein [Silicimonas sp. MF1-12-2]|uniref:hypothetical protein n=1 Tax=Silicimonas sp. MF1-12-2 TaxID=3384793 RepID=UPI0039B62F78
MTDRFPNQAVKPERMAGAAHLFAAAGYSAAGVRRLWQGFAREAKELGSLATMCLLFANGVFILAVVASSFSPG